MSVWCLFRSQRWLWSLVVFGICAAPSAKTAVLSCQRTSRRWILGAGVGWSLNGRYQPAEALDWDGQDARSAERFARAMASEAALSYEKRIAPFKQELFQALDATCAQVLELGIGSGPNLPYYGSGVKKLTGLDPNPFMLARSEGKRTPSGVLPELVQGLGERMPFKDGSFDAVCSTLVLCSVDDPELVVQEIARVLRPGGRWIFLEHVHALEGAPPLLALAQNALDPLQVAFAAGCHLNRRTGELIRRSPLFVRVDPVVEFSAMGPRGEQFLISPHVMGVAWKAPLEEEATA